MLPNHQKEKGIIHLLPLEVILVLVVVGAVSYLFISGTIKLPSAITSLFQEKATVELQETYKNPFKKETQYVNPFDTYKNPFVVSK